MCAEGKNGIIVPHAADSSHLIGNLTYAHPWLKVANAIWAFVACTGQPVRKKDERRRAFGADHHEAFHHPHVREKFGFR